MTKKELTKKKILDTAKECFYKSGYINTSMADIVENSGISKGGIYWHFKSKEEIFVQIIEIEYDIWLDYVNSELEKVNGPVNKLRKYGHIFFELVDEPVWRMLPQSYWGELGEHYLERLNKCYNKDDELLKELFDEAIEKDLLNLTDSDELTWVYISTIEGLFAKIALEFDNQDKLKAYANTAIDLFIDKIEK